MPESFTIRPATETDAARYAEIEADAYDPKYSEPAPVFLGKWRAFPAGCLMVEVDGQCVAHLISHPWIYDDPPPLNPTHFMMPAAPDVFFIHSLAIMRAFHGRGIGRALVQRAMDLARTRGLSRVTLVSVQGSEVFWHRFGFKTVDPLPEAVRASLSGYGMSARFMEAKV